MKGIVLAGGSGTRLFPVTQGVSKQLLPIYDKPMIYYPLSVLMLAKIQDILIITTPKDVSAFKRLLGDGSQFGISLNYAVQPVPKGLAEAFIIGDKFIGNNSVCLVLGDNLFWGQGLSDLLKKAVYYKNGATIFGYQVKDPQRFGVVSFDQNQKVINIEEKPKKPKSNYAVTGLYFYDNDIIQIAKNIKPSARGELEITDVNIEYMKQKLLNIEILGRGFAWFDSGTHKSLLEATIFVEAIENRQGLKIACLEEIAYQNSWISAEQVHRIAQKLFKNEYGQYLMRVLND